MKLIENKEKVYDGQENQELYATVFNVKNNVFTLPAILINTIEHLKDQISNEDFLKIVKESKFQTDKNSDFKKHFKDFDFEEYYQSQEGLSVYYVIKDNLLYLFSFGEYQPTRYMLFIESVWEL
jgi:hypothetical protein